MMFKGKYEFLSNFYPSVIYIDGKAWPTVEHYYQACKTINPDLQEHIRRLDTPGKTKRAGNKVTLRSNWNEVRISVMINAVTAKFFQHIELADRLKDTGNLYIEEGNYWHDNFWGNCYCQKCVNTQGKNTLGKIIMEIRRYI
jgi:hypothetical protein